jgi:hypothetical protein
MPESITKRALSRKKALKEEPRGMLDQDAGDFGRIYIQGRFTAFRHGKMSQKV